MPVPAEPRPLQIAARFARKLRMKLERIWPGSSYVHTRFAVGCRCAAELGAIGDAAELSGDRSAAPDVRLRLAATR